MNILAKLFQGFSKRADDTRSGVQKTVLGGIETAKTLSYKNNILVSEVPSGYKASRLDIENCRNLTFIPPDLAVRILTIKGCPKVVLPSGLKFYELAMPGAPILSLPDSLEVANQLDLSDCTQLERLPDGLKVGTLVLRGCTALTALPEGLVTSFLDISGCTALRDWPAKAQVKFGRVIAQGCTGLTSIPQWLTEISALDLRGCSQISSLPDTLRVTSWLDIAGAAITSLPKTISPAALRWKGIPIDERIAFRPETITATEVLATKNAERRRILIERMGYEKFLSESTAETLDKDTDPGGERRLLKVAIEGDEPLVCLSILCPSTGRQYVVRVPPKTTTCRKAAAWIAGFDNEKDYRPIAET